MFQLLLISVFSSMFLLSGINKDVVEIEKVRCWRYEKFSFENDGRIIIEHAYLSFKNNGEVWFHGSYDSNIHGKTFRNTFTLVDSSDARVAVVVIEHHLECGVDELKSRAVSYKRYSKNPTASISWKGWEVDDLENCAE